MKSTWAKLFPWRYFFGLLSLARFYFPSMLWRGEHSIGRQTNHWFAVMLSDVKTNRDCEKFDQWFNSSIENSEQFSQLEDIWETVAHYTNRSEIKSACESAYRRMS